MKIGIIGTGAYLPEKILTNLDIEKMVDTSDEWIMSRTGIRERRIAGTGIASSDIGCLAAKRACKNARIAPQDIELIIVATTTPDMQFPSTACLVQRKLSIKHAACFDVSAACAGFVYSLVVAEGLIASKRFKNALVIGAEVLSTIVDWRDRNTCVLFGDGAGACVLAPVKRGGILSSYLSADGQYSHLLEMPAGGSRFPASPQTLRNRMHYIKMEGRDVFKFAVRKMTDAARQALNLSGLSLKEIDCFIPHQANIRIINAIARSLRLPQDKVYINLDRYGNMSSASSAVALCEAIKYRRIKRGDTVLIVAFGSGLAWGACVIKW